MIDFPNNDRILHNVFSYSPARTFDLGVYKKGESRAVQFDRPGPIELFCSIHSSMYAQIYVTPNPFFAVTDSDGAFLIENVPIGKYTLRTWNKRLPEGVESIEVRDIDVRVGAPVVISVEMGGS